MYFLGKWFGLRLHVETKIITVWKTRNGHSQMLKTRLTSLKHRDKILQVKLLAFAFFNGKHVSHVVDTFCVWNYCKKLNSVEAMTFLLFCLLLWGVLHFFFLFHMPEMWATKNLTFSSFLTKLEPRHSSKQKNLSTERKGTRLVVTENDDEPEMHIWTNFHDIPDKVASESKLGVYFIDFLISWEPKTL